MFEGRSSGEAESLRVARMKAMKAARVYVRTGSWEAWLYLVVAAAVVGLPVSSGHAVVLALPAAGILVVFGLWRWL